MSDLSRDNYPPRKEIARPAEEHLRVDETLEDQEKILAGQPDVNMPALLTKDVQGG